MLSCLCLTQCLSPCYLVMVAAIHLDQMDFWKKDIRRLTLQRQKRALDQGDDKENESTNSPPKKKRKIKRVKPRGIKVPAKPKEDEFASLSIGGSITLKGDGYEVGDFGLLLTEALSTEMKIDCKTETISIQWDAWPCTSKRKLRIQIDISSIDSLFLGAYQKWKHSKQEFAFIDFKMKKGKTPSFLQRLQIRGQTETEAKFEEIEDFTRGSALRTQKHRFKVRCLATRSKLHNLYQNLLASEKFDKIALDQRFH